jgi:hypothetical protein
MKPEPHPPLSGGRCILSFFQGLRVRPWGGGGSIRPFQRAAASFPFFRGSESVPGGGGGSIRPFQGAAASFPFSGAPSPLLAREGDSIRPSRGPLHLFLFSGAPSPSLAVGWGYSIRPFQGAAASFPFFRGPESVPSRGGGFHPPLSGGRCILSFFQGLWVLTLQGEGRIPSALSGDRCNFSFSGAPSPFRAEVPSAPFRGLLFIRGFKSFPSRGSIRPFQQGIAASSRFSGAPSSFLARGGGAIPSDPVRGPLHLLIFSGAPILS